MFPSRDDPPGSLGEAYNRALALRETERKSKGIIWTSEQCSRDDWPRAWRSIGPTFGDFAPTAVHAEDLLALRAKVAQRVSESEAFRVIKVWRALWAKLSPLGYKADPNADPSLTFSNAAPAPRQELWPYRDVLKLVQRAWREGYFGLSAAIAVAWDTMLREAVNYPALSTALPFSETERAIAALMMGPAEPVFPARTCRTCDVSVFKTGALPHLGEQLPARAGATCASTRPMKPPPTWPPNSLARDPMRRRDFIAALLLPPTMERRKRSGPRR